MRKMSDCKVGDWRQIGKKDGAEALTARFEERKKFCSWVDNDKINTDSAVQYQQGWEEGNQDFWYGLGVEDGKKPVALGYFQERLKSEIVLENKTPIQEAMYQKGWIQGNAEYWSAIGHKDGSSGLSSTMVTQRMQEGQLGVGFNRAAYEQAWELGNQAYWTRLGYLDANQGVSDLQFSQHATEAQQKQVKVNQAAYIKAWELELIEYWKKTAWSDATSGWDKYMRRVDAQKRQLKFLENEYQSMWEQRLLKYWSDAGSDDGFGFPNRLAERMSNVRVDKVFVIPQTQQVYLDAWKSANYRYCDVDHGFNSGRKNQMLNFSVCSPAQLNRARFAWESGREYEMVLSKQRHLRIEMDHVINRIKEVTHRMRQLETPINNEYKKIDNNNKKEGDKKEIDKKNYDSQEQIKRWQQELDRLRRAHTAHVRELDDLRHHDERYDLHLQRLKRNVYQ
jgi:hypothetical protein